MSDVLLNKAIQIRDEIEEGANTAERVGSILVNMVTEIDNKAGKEDTQLGLFYLGFDVNTSSDLTTPTITNPNTQEVITLIPGNAVKVKNVTNEEGLSYIYQYDGFRWNRTIYTALPADVALKGGTNSSVKQVEDGLLYAVNDLYGINTLPINTQGDLPPNTVYRFYFPINIISGKKYQIELLLDEDAVTTATVLMSLRTVLNASNSNIIQDIVVVNNTMKRSNRYEFTATNNATHIFLFFQQLTKSNRYYIKVNEVVNEKTSIIGKLDKVYNNDITNVLGINNLQHDMYGDIIALNKSNFLESNTVHRLYYPYNIKKDEKYEVLLTLDHDADTTETTIMALKTVLNADYNQVIDEVAIIKNTLRDKTRYLFTATNDATDFYLLLHNLTSDNVVNIQVNKIEENRTTIIEQNKLISLGQVYRLYFPYSIIRKGQKYRVSLTFDSPATTVTANVIMALRTVLNADYLQVVDEIANAYKSIDSSLVYEFTATNDATDFYLLLQDFSENNNLSIKVESYPYVSILDRIYNLEKITAPSLSALKLSILGDSISSYLGYVPNGYNVWYPNSDVNAVNKTWWGRLLEYTGMQLEVNNSFSGSKIALGDSTRIAFCEEVRLSNLGNPDIIILFGGTNDFSAGYTLGNAKESLTSTDLTVFANAYSYTITELKKRYPKAMIFPCIPLERAGTVSFERSYPSKNTNGIYFYEYSNIIRELCNIHGLHCIELDKLISSYFNSNTNSGFLNLYTIDGTHPNSLLMELIFKEVLASIYRYFRK